MIEIKLANEPFVFKNNSYSNYYNYFTYIDDNQLIGLLTFDVEGPTLTEIEFSNNFTTFNEKDALIRTALYYMMVHGYKECRLNVSQFQFFIDKYADKNVIINDLVDLEKFFSLECAH